MHRHASTDPSMDHWYILYIAMMHADQCRHCLGHDGTCASVLTLIDALDAQRAAGHAHLAL